MRRSQETFSNRICNSLTHARSPLGGDNAAQSQTKALKRAAENPTAAAPCVETIAEILVAEVRDNSDTALKLFSSDSMQSKVVVKRALIAIRAIATEASERIGQPSVLDKLVEVLRHIDPALKAPILKIFQRCDSTADSSTVDEKIVPMLQEVSNPDDSSIGVTTVETAGYFLGNEVSDSPALLRCIEDAFESGSTELQSGSLRAIGLALTGATPPYAIGRRLLDPEELPAESAIHKSVAIGACHALAGDDKARSIGHDVIEWFLSHDDPDVREHLPRAIGETLEAESPDAPRYKQMILSQTIDDPHTDVREATVWATIEPLQIRDDLPEDVHEASVSIVKRALFDYSTREHEMAVDAISRISGELYETTGTARRLLDRLLDTVISNDDPRKRHRARDAIYTFELPEDKSANDTVVQTTLDDREVEKVDAADNPIDFEEHGEKLLETLPSRSLPKKFQAARTVEQKCVTIAAIGHAFQTPMNSDQLVLQLWRVLLEAWAQNEARLQEQVLVAVRKGVEAYNIDQTTAFPLFEQGAVSEEPDVRARTLIVLGQLLQNAPLSNGRAGLDWEDTREYILDGLQNDVPAVQRAAVEALNWGLLGPSVEWDAVLDVLGAAAVDEHDVVAFEAIRLLGIGLEREEIRWADVSAVHRTIISEGDGQAVEEALDNVGCAIKAGSAELADVKDSLDYVLECGDEAVAPEAVRPIGTGLWAETQTWDDVAEFIRQILDDSRPDVVTTGIGAINRGLTSGAVDWADIEDIVPHLLVDPRNPVAEATANTLCTAFSESDLDWTTTREIFMRGIRDERTDVATNAIATTTSGLLVGADASWSEVRPLFDEARNSSDLPVVKTAIYGAAIAYQKDEATWEQVSPFLTAALSGTRIQVRTSVFEALGELLARECVEWYRVEPFLFDALDDEPDTVAVSAITAARRGLDDGSVTWAESEGVISEALRLKRPNVTADVAMAVGCALVEGAVEWTDVEADFASFITHRHEAVAKAAAMSIHDSLLSGTVRWAQVTDILEVAFRSRHESVAAFAVRALNPGLFDHVDRFNQVDETLRTAVNEAPDDAAIRAIQTVGIAIQTDVDDWSQIEEFLRFVLQDGREDIAATAIEIIGHGIRDRTLRWDDFGALHRLGLEDGREKVVISAITNVGNALRENLIRWDVAAEFLADALELDVPDVGVNVSRTIASGLVDGPLTWRQVTPFWVEILETHPEARRIAYGTLQMAEFDAVDSWADIGPVLEYVYRNGPPRERYRLQLVLETFVRNVRTILTDDMGIDDEHIPEPGSMLVSINDPTSGAAPVTIPGRLLTEMMDDSEPGIRDHTVELTMRTVLGGREDIDAARRVLRTAADDGDWGVRRTAVNAIGGLIAYDRENFETLFSMLPDVAQDDSEPPRVRASAFYGIARSGQSIQITLDEQLSEILKQGIDTDSAHVQMAALRCSARLLSTGDAPSEAPQRQLLNAVGDAFGDATEPVKVREKAAEALIRIHRETNLVQAMHEAVPTLRRWLADVLAEPSTRLEVVDILVQTKHQALD